ncbi:hypothetical protein EDL79_03555 [Ehrlichia ruminantium]|uniref:Peptidase M17 leucyl aminopeptidase N-terminal domain-containing protein n=1 Tax=Ehrlichia ruminantium TaxID=779 RepID=A0AAE6QAD9_EHRRU|nr:hypothetical protein [Ehrlichia ruminantium]QGR02698.1 hypothetical protein EDL81_03540 [Ehrlichia ruminantium]QGR03619.1 hypothetical protein EDL80_03545 [Ehrlichia ruminantium]QGR04546.1 hypothetical protein EDL79_03555 [Ehrlichia ruminantium]
MIDITFLDVYSGFAQLVNTQVIVLGIFEGSNHLEDYGYFSDDNTLLEKIRNCKSFENGKFGRVITIPIQLGDPVFPTVIVVGLGLSQDFDNEKALKLGSIIYSEISKAKALDKSIVPDQDFNEDASVITINDSNIAAHIAYGAFLRSMEMNKDGIEKEDDGYVHVKKLVCFLGPRQVSKATDFFNTLKNAG